MRVKDSSELENISYEQITSSCGLVTGCGCKLLGALAFSELESISYKLTCSYGFYTGCGCQVSGTLVFSCHMMLDVCGCKPKRLQQSFGLIQAFSNISYPVYLVSFCKISEINALLELKGLKVFCRRKKPTTQFFYSFSSREIFHLYTQHQS